MTERSGLYPQFELDGDSLEYDGANRLRIKPDAALALGAITASSATVSGDVSAATATVSGAVTVGDSLVSSGNGTVTTPATTAVEERGDSIFHYTKLTMTAFAMGTSGDAAALALGAKFYTLPAGDFIIENATMVGTILAAISDKDAASSEVGIGTVVGSGVNATLGAVNAAAENVCGPVVIAAYNDTAVVGVTIAAAAQPFLRIAASGGLARDLFLNTATTWADVTAVGAVTFTGVITLKWRKID